MDNSNPEPAGFYTYMYIASSICIGLHTYRRRMSRNRTEALAGAEIGAEVEVKVEVEEE